MAVTRPQTEAIILSYFRTGDTPTQDQYEELIGTMYDLFAAAQSAVDAAIGDVGGLVAASARVVGRLEYDKTTDDWTTHLLQGATVAFSGAGNRTVTVTFSAAFASTADYFEMHNSDNTAIGTITPTKNAATLVYVISDDSGFLNLLVHGNPP